ISAVLDAIDPKNLVDVVFAIDATGSMKDDIELLRKKLISRLQEKLKSFGDVRFGLLFYRDYGDNFNTRGLPVKQFDFTNDFEEFSKNLNSIKIRGTEGGDIPEAVYEALFACMDFYKWRGGATKKVILIGDAEPHPTPRRSGKYSKELVEKTAAERGISVSAIITPDDKARRGR
ncbi:MAG: VWA domain-containing protein, partial [Treponemataceae bacterium]|nr:VWA domain-containing protein [Treponemataceae bacterium]